MWELVTVAEALVGVLESTGTRSFATPPDTFNAPAYVVEFPDLVNFDTGAIGVDVATVPVLVGVGQTEPQRLGELVAAARKAIAADPTLGHVVALARATELRNVRILTVGGAALLTGQLLIEVRT